MFLGRSHRIHTWAILPPPLPSERREKNEDRPTWRPRASQSRRSQSPGQGQRIYTSKNVAGEESWPAAAHPEPRPVSRPVSEDLKGLPGVQVEPARPRNQFRGSSVGGSPQGLPQAQAHLWVSGWESSIQALVLQKKEGAVCAMQQTWFDPWVGNIPCRKEWSPSPVFLPGEFHRQRNLVGYSPWGCKELDMTARLTLMFEERISFFKKEFTLHDIFNVSPCIRIA